MRDEALVVGSAVLFGFLFHRSGIWGRTKDIGSRLSHTLTPFGDRMAGDEARERAARDAAILLARYAVLTIAGLAVLVALSLAPLGFAIAAGWSDVASLWRASLEPAVIVVSLIACALAARL